MHGYGSYPTSAFTQLAEKSCAAGRANPATNRVGRGHLLAVVLAVEEAGNVDRLAAEAGGRLILVGRSLGGAAGAAFEPAVLYSHTMTLRRV